MAEKIKPYYFLCTLYLHIIGFGGSRHIHVITRRDLEIELIVIESLPCAADVCADHIRRINDDPDWQIIAVAGVIECPSRWESHLGKSPTVIAEGNAHSIQLPQLVASWNGDKFREWQH